MKINLQNRPLAQQTQERLPRRLPLRQTPENRQTNHTHRLPMPIRIRRPLHPQKSPRMILRTTRVPRQHPPPINHNRFNKRTTKNLKRPQILAALLRQPNPPKMLLKRETETKPRKCYTLSSILQTPYLRIRAIQREKVSFQSKGNFFWNFLCALAKRA